MKNNKVTDPTALPSTPDRAPTTEFSSYPSTSLQSVLKHNEDLMARLSVNLRRVGHLEKIIEDLTLRVKVEKSSSDSLRDELLIFTEKNRLSESQLQKHIGDLSRSTRKIEQLDVETQALKSDFKSQEAKYEFKISQLELEVHELSKIKTDTEDYLKPQLHSFKGQVTDLQTELEGAKAKNEELKDKLISLSHQAQSEALKFQNILKDLQSKIKDKDLIINKYEALDEKVKSLSKDKAVLENKKIDLEHDLKKVSSEKNTEVENLQRELALKSAEVQKFKVENHELKKAWAESHNKTKEVEQKNNVLEEQAQTLQYMWQEKNKKYSDLESQVKILETMRHELSLKVNSRDIEIKDKNQKISDLLNLIEMMKSKGLHEKEAILETAIRGMRSLYFEETSVTSVVKIKEDSI